MPQAQFACGIWTKFSVFVPPIKWIPETQTLQYIIWWLNFKHEYQTKPDHIYHINPSTSYFNLFLNVFFCIVVLFQLYAFALLCFFFLKKLCDVISSCWKGDPGLFFRTLTLDGENANLVRRENNDVQENRDTWRDREDESDEERNVRPWRELPSDYFFM